MLQMNKQEKSRTDKTGRERREGKAMKEGRSHYWARWAILSRCTRKSLFTLREEEKNNYIMDYCLLLHFCLAFDSERMAK